MHVSRNIDYHWALVEIEPNIGDFGVSRAISRFGKCPMKADAKPAQDFACFLGMCTEIMLPFRRKISHAVSSA